MELKDIPHQTLDKRRVGRSRRHERRAEVGPESIKMEERPKGRAEEETG